MFYLYKKLISQKHISINIKTLKSYYTQKCTSSICRRYTMTINRTVVSIFRINKQNEIVCYWGCLASNTLYLRCTNISLRFTVKTIQNNILTVTTTNLALIETYVYAIIQKPRIILHAALILVFWEQQATYISWKENLNKIKSLILIIF